MARRHEEWIVGMFGGLDERERGALHALLAKLKATSTPRTAKGSDERETDPLRRSRRSTCAGSCDDGVATITLDRPERKNPLTFASYAELRDLFRELPYARDVHAVVLSGAGGNFCSGGDVHEIIAPLTAMAMPELLAFTRMTGDVVKAMRACPQPIVAAVDGVCAGAGAMLALASDVRFGTPPARVAFLFTRVGLGRRRHGRVRAAAARRRARARVGAALQRPLAAGGRGAGVGVLQPPVRAGRRARRSARVRAHARATGRRSATR